MKILILSDTFPEDINAFEEIDFNLASVFSKKGHDVFVLTVTQDKNEIGWDKNFNEFNVYRIYINSNQKIFRHYLGLCNLFIIKQLKEILKDISPDVIHAHKINRFLSYFLLKLSHKYCRAVFFTAHDKMSFNNGLIKSSLTEPCRSVSSFAPPKHPANIKAKQINKILFIRNFLSLNFYIK
jgi:glycosyltransferase involved in cell wall biosynthesis